MSEPKTVKLKKDGTPDGRSLRMMDPEVKKKLWEARIAKAAAGDPHAMGGRPRKPTRDEAFQNALEELWPKAFQRLNAILDDPKSTPPQIMAASKMIWEAKFGKAAPVRDDGEPLTAIEYITTAFES